MMLTELCLQCGAALESLVLCTDPPMVCKNCPVCGWHWVGKRTGINRIQDIWMERGDMDTN